MFREQREKFLRSRDLKIILKFIDPKNMNSFLREFGLYKPIVKRKLFKDKIE